jgi:predicted DNA-binding transcriptional regulator YafY
MRSSRLLSMLMRLQLRGRVPARALASEFEVSLRTVYRDLDALSAAGVPVHAERGRGGGIVLAPGWRTQLTGLTQDEAKGVVLGGLRGAAHDLGLGAAAANVQLKLLASMAPQAAADAGRMADRFLVDPVPWYHRAEHLPLLPALAAAVWEGRRVRVRYESWQGSSSSEAPRELSPLGLVIKGGLWYLVAMRHSTTQTQRSAATPRTYRVASILDLQTLNKPCAPPRGFVLSVHWPQSVSQFETSLLVGKATVRLSPEGVRILRAEQPVAAEWVHHTQKPCKPSPWVEAELPVEHEPHAARMLLRLGSEVQVRKPASLRAAIAREASAVAKAHRRTLR